jgi:hypothetical protein
LLAEFLLGKILRDRAEKDVYKSSYRGVPAHGNAQILLPLIFDAHVGTAPWAVPAKAKPSRATDVFPQVK